MTKDDVEKIVKQYSRIKEMIKIGKHEHSFYIGHRLKHIQLTEETKRIYAMIEEVFSAMEKGWERDLVNGILRGKSDVYLLQHCPCGRSLYYTIKKGFIDKVFCCCIARQMVPYEEVLQMKIYG